MGVVSPVGCPALPCHLVLRGYSCGCCCERQWVRVEGESWGQVGVWSVLMGQVRECVREYGRVGGCRVYGQVGVGVCVKCTRGAGACVMMRDTA